MLVGDLVVRMSADIADLRTAFQKAAPEVVGSMQNISSSFDLARTALETLGVVAAIHYFDKFVSEALDAQASLASLSEKSGLAVETLSALRSAATITGENFEGAVTATEKFAKSLYLSAAGGSKQASEALRVLGIDVLDANGKLRSADDLLLAVAVAFSQMQAGIEKTAIAQQLFSRGGAEAIPILNKLGEEGLALAQVSTAQAEAAHALETRWNTLKLEGQGLVNQVTAAMVPSLTALVVGFTNVINQTGGLRDKWNQLVASGEVWAFFQRVAVAAAEMADAVVDVIEVTSRLWQSVVTGSGVFSGFGTIMKGVGEILRGEWYQGMIDVSNGWDKVTASTKGALATFDGFAASHVFQDAVYAQIIALGEHESTIKNKTIPVVENLSKAHKQAASDVEKLTTKFLELMQADALGVTPNTIKQLSELDLMLLMHIIPDAGIYAALVEQAIQQDSKYASGIRDANKEIKARDEAISKATIALTKDTEEIDKAIERQEKHNAELLGGRDAWIAVDLARIENQRIALQGRPGEEADLRYLDEQEARLRRLGAALADTDAITAAQKAARQIADYWKGVAGEIDQTFRQTFMKMFDGTGSAWKDLVAGMKKIFLEMAYELEVRPIVLNIVAGVSGGVVPGLAAGSQDLLTRTGGGGTGLIGNLFGDNILSSVTQSIFGTSLGSGSGVLSSLFGDAFATSMGAGLSADLSTLGIAAQAGASAVGGFGAVIGAAIPVIGAVAGVGALLYSIFGSSGGGPKSGGFAATGPTPGITGTDSSGRWMTPSDKDSTILSQLTQLNDLYKQTAEALGGVAVQFSFALGYATDPQGKAPTNVHSGVFSPTGQIYNAENPNVGRSEADLTAEMQIQAQRMLLAALQSTALPTAVHNALMAADVNSSSIEQITAALKNAAAAAEMIQTLTTAVKALPIEVASGLVEAIGKQPEVDAAIANFVNQVVAFGAAQKKFDDESKAFWAASNSVQDALDRDPTAEAQKAYAASLNTTFEKVGIAKDALIELTGKYDGSTQATKDLADATNAYRDAQREAIVQVYAMRDALLGPDGLFANTQHTIDWALMTKTEQINWLIGEAIKYVNLLSTTTDPEQINKFDRLINQDLTQAFNLMDPEAQKVQHDYIQGILEHAAQITDTQLTAAEGIINDSTIAAGTTLGAVQQVLDEAGQRWNDAAQKFADNAQLIADAAQKIVDASDLMSSGGADQKAAATDMLAAAAGMLAAANEPVKVELLEPKGP